MTGGKDACSVPPIKRSAVDTAALSMFERWSLDVEGTKAALAEEVSERVSETVVEADRAAREAEERRGGLAIIERDYTSGSLPVEEYTRLRAKLGDELVAVEAERDRLVAQAERVRAFGGNLDAEHETLQRLTEIRKAIAEHVSSAKTKVETSGDVGALRAAIGSVFEVGYIRPAEHPITRLEGYADSAEPVVGRAYWIEPRLREDAIVMREEEGAGRAILRQVPLQFEDRSLVTGRGVPE